MTEIKRIETRDELIALANQLGMRPDWDEPAERGVTAAVFGTELDNTGFWGSAASFDGQSLPPELDADGMEIWVVLHHDGKPAAEVCLATLFAFATGFDG
jgi:hypothetical protein